MVWVTVPQHWLVSGAHAKTATHMDPSASVARTLQLPEVGEPSLCTMSTEISGDT